MFEYILYCIGEFISLHLPLKFAYGIAIFFNDLRYPFAFQDRKAVTANLKSILPEKTDQEIAKIRIQMFHNFSKYLVDFFRTPLLDRDYIKKNIRLANIHYLDESLKNNKGVIIITAHLGNWELGGEVLGLLGYRVSCVALPHKNKKVDTFFNTRRESKGLKVIPLGKAFRTCLSLLKNNQLVALVCDRDFTENEMVEEFLGKPAFLPTGPAACALLTGAVILPTFMLRNCNDTFILYFEKPIDVSRFIELKVQGRRFKKVEKNLIKEVISSYKGVVEGYIRQHPNQWYVFRRYWKE